MYQPWTTDERQILCASRAPSDAVAALPHRSRAAVLTAGNRFGAKWPRPGRHPRGPQTLDERRFAVVLAAVAHGGTLTAAELIDLCRATNWRAVADMVRSC